MTPYKLKRHDTLHVKKKKRLTTCKKDLLYVEIGLLYVKRDVMTMHAMRMTGQGSIRMHHAVTRSGKCWVVVWWGRSVSSPIRLACKRERMRLACELHTLTYAACMSAILSRMRRSHMRRACPHTLAYSACIRAGVFGLGNYLLYTPACAAWQAAYAAYAGVFGLGNYLLS